MSGKRKNKSLCDTVRKRSRITMETKVGVINEVEKGRRIRDVAHAFHFNTSTICTILKDKERILKHVKDSAPLQATIITKKRGIVMEEMEKLLILWIQENHDLEISVSRKMVKEKALSLFKDVKQKHGKKAKDQTFLASNGWFENFKSRANLHILNGELKTPQKTFENSEEADVVNEDKINIARESNPGPREVNLSDMVVVQVQDLASSETTDVERCKAEGEEERKLVPRKKFNMNKMNEAFHLIGKGLSLLEAQDSNVMRFNKVSNAIHNDLMCYRIIYGEKKKEAMQTNLDQLIQKLKTNKQQNTSNTNGPTSST